MGSTKWNLIGLCITSDRQHFGALYNNAISLVINVDFGVVQGSIFVLYIIVQYR